MFLLGRNPDGFSDLEDVLDFFEALIAQKTVDNFLDDREVYSYFYHWIRLYWQASKEYVENYRREEPMAWGTIQELHDIVTTFEKKEIKKDTGREPREDELFLSKDKMHKQLEKEARLTN